MSDQRCNSIKGDDTLKAPVRFSSSSYIHMVKYRILKENVLNSKLNVPSIFSLLQWIFTFSALVQERYCNLSM